MRRLSNSLPSLLCALLVKNREEEKSMAVHLSTSTYIPPSLISLGNAYLDPEYSHPVQLDFETHESVPQALCFRQAEFKDTSEDLPRFEDYITTHVSYH
jgi:hypothetical protein